MHRLDSFVDQLHGVPKETETVNLWAAHLRFGGLDASWVLVLLLEVVEEQLTWCC